MGDLTLLGWIALGLLTVLALYVTLGMLGLLGATHLARTQEEIPRSLDCRDGRHKACPTCSCRCHR